MIEKCSIIIPIYNSSQFIEESLNSIEKQTANIEAEVILIDDKSDDLGILKNKTENFKRFPIRLIEKKVKSNAATSRNLGLKLSSSDYIFLLDSDDLFMPEHIEQRIETHKRTKAGIIFSDFNLASNQKIKDENIKRSEFILSDMREYLFGNNQSDFRTSTISICKYFYKETLFDDRQNKHQDWGFAARASDNNEKIYFSSSKTIIINEQINPLRMSNKQNLAATDYFIEQYLSDKKHVVNFCKRHIGNAIRNQDTNATAYYRKKLLPYLKETPIKLKNFNIHFLLLFSPSLISRTLLRIIDIFKLWKSRTFLNSKAWKKQ
ncbi:glycosyltransferase family 2 protein [Halopseudomonas salegens]